MSAWVVSKAHIDVLVKSALVTGERSQYRDTFRFTDGKRSYEVTRSNVNEIGQMLVDECVKSVSYRYPDDDVKAGELPGPMDAYYTHPYEYANPGFQPTPKEISHAASCYDYQSCEHPEYRDSAAHAFIMALQLAQLKHLPGDDGPWGWDDDDVRKRREGDPEPISIMDMIGGK